MSPSVQALVISPRMFSRPTVDISIDLCGPAERILILFFIFLDCSSKSFLGAAKNHICSTGSQRLIVGGTKLNCMTFK